MTWRWVRLRWLMAATGGSWGNEPDEGEVVAPCVRATDFDYELLRTNVNRAPRRGFKVAEFSARSARRGDLIVEKSGGGEQQPVGRVVLHDTDVPVMPTNFASRLRPTLGAEPRFLCYLMAALYGSGLTTAAIKQTTGIQNLDLRSFLNNSVKVPSEADQSMIADYLDMETARIEALITRKRGMISLLDERFASAVVHLVTGSNTPGPRRPSGIDWIGDIPAHWGVPWLGAHYDTQLGKMLNAEATAGSDQFPYLRNTNVQWDRIDLDDLATMQFGPHDRAHCELRAGDLLVCEGGEVGRSAVWPGKPTGVYFQKALHRVRPRGLGNTRFLMYCLRAAALLQVFAIEGNQSTIVHLTGEQLRAHRFPYPPLEDQERLVFQLDAHRDRAAAIIGGLGRQIGLLQEHRQALITAAVTGELDVTGAA